MFVLKNLLFAIAHILNTVISLYIWVIILEAVFLWVHADPYNPIVRTINTIANFILAPLRRKVRFVLGMIDFTPMLAIFILIFIRGFVVKTLLDIVGRM